MYRRFAVSLLDCSSFHLLKNRLNHPQSNFKRGDLLCCEVRVHMHPCVTRVDTCFVAHGIFSGWKMLYVESNCYTSAGIFWVIHCIYKTCFAALSRAPAGNRAAGLVLFRRSENGGLSYLLLQEAYGEKHWTPPKSKFEDLQVRSWKPLIFCKHVKARWTIRAAARYTVQCFA